MGGISLGDDLPPPSPMSTTTASTLSRTPSLRTPERRPSGSNITPSSTGRSEKRGNTGLESRMTVALQGEELIEAIKRREEKLTKAENLTAKFLEASDGYHRIAKKLIEQKIASNRLWGLNI